MRPAASDPACSASLQPELLKYSSRPRTGSNDDLGRREGLLSGHHAEASSRSTLQPCSGSGNDFDSRLLRFLDHRFRKEARVDLRCRLLRTKLTRIPQSIFVEPVEASVDRGFPGPSLRRREVGRDGEGVEMAVAPSLGAGERGGEVGMKSVGKGGEGRSGSA